MAGTLNKTAARLSYICKMQIVCLIWQNFIISIFIYLTLMHDFEVS